MIAQAAKAARQQADRDMISAQSELKELKEQEEAQKVGILASIYSRQGKESLLWMKVVNTLNYESHPNQRLFCIEAPTCHTCLQDSACESIGCIA